MLFAVQAVNGPQNRVLVFSRQSQGTAQGILTNLSTIVVPVVVRDAANECSEIIGVVTVAIAEGASAAVDSQSISSEGGHV